MAIDRSLDEIFISCKSLIARVVSRLVPPNEIEDIVQETYVRVCRYQAKSDVKNHRALMVSTARNIAIDFLKRADTRLNTSLDSSTLDYIVSDDISPDPLFDQVSSDQEFALFCEVVRQLPQQCRKVFVLKKVYGYSQREIALELDLSESTVEKHVARGMKHCVSSMRRAQSNKDPTAEPHHVRRVGGKLL